MNQHISKDTALKLALGLLEAQAEQRLRKHLGKCTKCHRQLEEAERTLRVLGDITPNIAAPVPPPPFVHREHTGWLRVAAMLALGFALGFIASESLRSPSLTIVGQRILTTPPMHQANGFVTCEAVDVSSIAH